MEWISVKNRMPKINEAPRNEVLTWDGKQMDIRIPSFYDDGSSEFFRIDSDLLITHWAIPPEQPHD